MKWYMDEDGFPVAIDLSPGAKDTTKPYFPIREPPLEGGQDALPWRIESQSPQLTRSLFRNTKSHQYLCTNHSSNNLRQFHLSRTYRSLQWKQSLSSRTLGIVIREPTQDEEYLEQQSPDSVLFKDPSAVLQELTGNSLSQDEIMEEQCAIEADLLAQKLNDASHMLALASKMVPESCKRGPDVSSGKGEEGEPSAEPTLHDMDLSSGKSPEAICPDQNTKPRTRKRANGSKKEAASKKQQLETKKVEAASLKWLHPDK